MSHVQCTWLDRIPLLLFPLRGSNSCNQQRGVQLRRLAEHSSIVTQVVSCALARQRQRRRMMQSSIHRGRWAAAKFVDTISKLLRLAGERSDANSAYAQVKMTEALRLLRLLLEERPEIWFRVVPRQKNVKVGIILKTLWYILNGTYLVIHVAAFFGKDKFEEVLSEKGWT